jgi:hypothetical protein
MYKSNYTSVQIGLYLCLHSMLVVKHATHMICSEQTVEVKSDDETLILIMMIHFFLKLQDSLIRNGTVGYGSSTFIESEHFSKTYYHT